MIKFLFCFYQYMVAENNSFFYNYIIFFNPTITMNYHKLSIWLMVHHLSLNHFFYSKFCLICFFQFFFIKRSINFFTVKITNKICSRHSMFNFFNYSSFFRPIWNVIYCKNTFLFWYFYIVTNFKFRISFFIFLYQS